MAVNEDILFWILLFIFVLIVAPASVLPIVLYTHFGVEDNRICGYVFFPMVVIFLIIHVPIILLFRYNREFCKFRAFKVMFVLGVLECLQLFLQIYDGVKFLLSSIINVVVDGVYRSVLSALWDATICVTFLLAYNRFATIVLDDYPVFNSDIIYQIYLLVTALACTFSCSMYILMEVNRALGYELLIAQNTVVFTELAWNWTMFITTAVSYTAIIVFMIIKMRANVMIKKEWNLAIQAFIFSVFFTFSTTALDAIPDGLLDGYLLFYLMKIVWIIVDISNAIIYLCFNTRLRKAYFYFWRTGRLNEKPKKSSIAVISF